MKKLSPVAYKTLFFKHLWRFIQNIASAEELSRSHAVAVSGGLDSMTLLWFLNTLSQEQKIGPVRAIFVHHHTRATQDDDLLVVQKFCDQENIPFKALHAQGLHPGFGNFEAKARKMRRDLYRKELKKDELLWAGHHLDDSFEWNFMQRNRSTSSKSSIGIPVRNRRIIRPFLCVTKAQIKKIAHFENIPFLEDPTNKDLHYDRNFVRHKIVPLIKERYPKYLKFYSQFANFSAMMLKINVINRGGASDLFIFENGAILVGQYFSENQIQELIHYFSHANRGKMMEPIQKMLRAIDKKKKGPFHFSGGVEAYASHKVLMIYRQKIKNHDASIARSLQNLGSLPLSLLPSYSKDELKSAWKNLLSSPDAMMNMPGLVLVLESESICKTLNTSVFDPLFPEVSQLCKERGLRFITFTKCIDVWTQKKEKLPEKLRLLPLSNLSNLFTSQR